MPLPDPHLPPRACDCHVHVFSPVRFPYAADRAYTPPAAEAAELLAMQARLSLGRVVLVQPSVYGTDNRCMLDAIAQIGQDRARGVAVVDLLQASDAELRALHEGGVRSVRLNLKVHAAADADVKRQLEAAARLEQLPGWSLQLHAGLGTLVGLLDDLRRLPVPVVLDHYAGGLSGADDEADLDRLLSEMGHGHLYVKLSAPYRLSSHIEGHAQRLARQFHAAAPERLVWGSDWPHTGGSGNRGGQPAAVEPFRGINNAQVLRDLMAWLPDDDARHRVMVANPAALYGFAP